MHSFACICVVGKLITEPSTCWWRYSFEVSAHDFYCSAIEHMEGSLVLSSAVYLFLGQSYGILSAFDVGVWCMAVLRSVVHQDARI